MKLITIDAEEEDKEEQKRKIEDVRFINMNQVTKHSLKETFQKS
jgi:hypothetical protein